MASLAPPLAAAQTDTNPLVEGLRQTVPQRQLCLRSCWLDQLQEDLRTNTTRINKGILPSTMETSYRFKKIQMSALLHDSVASVHGVGRTSATSFHAQSAYLYIISVNNPKFLTQNNLVDDCGGNQSSSCRTSSFVKFSTGPKYCIIQCCSPASHRPWMNVLCTETLITPSKPTTPSRPTLLDLDGL